MDEEAMWKNLYETMQEAKNLPPTEHESQYVYIRRLNEEQQEGACTFECGYLDFW